MTRIDLNISCDNDQYVSILLTNKKGDNLNIFYAEFNDFDKTKIKAPSVLDAIKTLKFEPPQPDEDEYWTWGKLPLSVDLRGSKAEVRRYIEDWLKDLVGCAVSWVDYTDYGPGTGYRNIQPLPEDSTFEFFCVENNSIWDKFLGLWSDKTMPSYICKEPKTLMYK